MRIVYCNHGLRITCQDDEEYMAFVGKLLVLMDLGEKFGFCGRRGAQLW